MVLKDSLIQLLKEKPISSITVKELCELADVNRSTFYAHYYNQFDLLDKIEEETIEDMKGYMNKFKYEKKEDVPHIMENLLGYFSSNRDVCQTLLNETETTFQSKATVVAHQFFLKNWTYMNDQEEDLTEYLSTYVINGAIHVVKAWLANGMDKSPGEMAKILNHFINKGLER
ncbi:TetR-like C-terminal domain-containing protein [Bacillus horti]